MTCRLPDAFFTYRASICQQGSARAQGQDMVRRVVEGDAFDLAMKSSTAIQ